MRRIDGEEVNAQERGDFLARLLAENHKYIEVAACNAIEGISRDLIAGECSQAFLTGANAAIEKFNGTGNIEGWCKFKGLLAVKEFLRSEFGTATRYRKKHEMRTRVIYAEELYHRATTDHSLADHDPFDTIAKDTTDYAEQVVSNMRVRDILARLSPIDRSILQLLVYGEDENGTRIRTATTFGSAYRRTNHDLSVSTGLPERIIEKRIRFIREQFKNEQFA